MGKEKGKGTKGVQNQHLHARVSYLHQACTYLATQYTHTDDPHAPVTQQSTTLLTELQTGHTETDTLQDLHTKGLPLRLNAHLRSVAQKSQIRLHSTIKHTICKRCNASLLESAGTCTRRVENLSKGSKKSWADVLILECLNCHCVRRFPVGAQRQTKKANRAKPAEVRMNLDPKVVEDGDPKAAEDSAG